jgi:LPS-assembly lipoprotein
MRLPIPANISAAAKAGLLAPLAILGGCAGFTPMYATAGVSPKLSAIAVNQPDGRLGFLLRENLDDSLARDSQQPAIYRLNLANREVRSGQGITVANVASRYEVDLTTKYTLTEIATGKLVTQGQVVVNVTYDVVSQPYAALSAEQDSERRVAEQAADRIRLELATFFASPRPVPSQAALQSASAPTFSADPDHQAAVIQTPRQMATGVMTSGGGETDILGQPRQAVTTPDQPQIQPFNPSQDPNNAAPDPAAIKTLPDAGGSGQ